MICLINFFSLSFQSFQRHDASPTEEQTFPGRQHVLQRSTVTVVTDVTVDVTQTGNGVQRRKREIEATSAQTERTSTTPSASCTGESQLNLLSDSNWRLQAFLNVQ